MDRRRFIAGSVALISAPAAAEAQARTYKVGLVSHIAKDGSRPGYKLLTEGVEVFRHELRRLGYLEGQNLTVQVRNEVEPGIRELLETDILGATRLLRISWDEAWHIQERAVARGQRAKSVSAPRYLGVDEKAAAKGHRYLTLVCDLEQATVEYIADDRKQASLNGYFHGLTDGQRAGIQAVALDMWEPFVQSVLTHVPDGARKIVFDRFHIMGHMGDAVDRVRKREHRTLQAAGDATLTGSKYLWLYGAERMPEKHQERFLVLQALNLKTARAWAIKETLRQLWRYHRTGWAERHWTRWYFRATHSRLAPVIDVARLLKRHRPNVMTYFTHRITNAVSEGLNSKIQTIKKRAYGFRNREHFKTAIYFHCGGLNLYPATHSIPG